MPKDEWGVKRVCPTCSTRFYDLQNDPMTCPSCGAAFTIESLTAVKTKALRPEKAKPEPEDTDDLPEVEADDDSLGTDDDLDDEILEDDDDSVDLDEIADVASEDDES
ncbi:MAG TPA: TIGR02300 family protein [Amaricoccus sp.]|uniref:TIGR02300 family protein n=1 Tax=Amaricoccus sp. TaxID=1872485 RepID=UPI002C6CA2F9|nr:TIGR02300 family protein [Amaricoccus sp.]HMQ93600.1 TIGR02300 family protein [Amaricoccus sp.]HMR54371.1 TIGR02300 family protein [Amaricoccus sp.]HMR61158.1 TIGR02300 family protein [Amaricoccus sp.]HMU01372.1 TIGR02300 family protein [Amaricoccus sp.]